MTRYLYGYSTPPLQLTVAELELRQTWRGLDPEFRRRLIALFNASNGTLGIGGGWRSSVQQEALFRSRYTPHNEPPGVLWQNQYWRLKPGMAPSTPPGRSYHESTTPSGAIAADLIGNLSFGIKHGAEFGLRDLSDVNNEPWHFQPVEVPTARRNYNGAPLKPWPLPNDPPEADVKYLRVRVPNDPTRAEALVLIDIRGYNTPAERDAVTRVLSTEDRPVTADQYDALLAVFKA